MTTNGASYPGPIASWTTSKSWRTSLLLGSCSVLGGPVFSPIAGVARIRTMPPMIAAAAIGRRSAASTKVITALRSAAPARPIRQRLTLEPSRASSAGATTEATLTLMMTTTIRVPASETSSAPGRIGIATTIARKSVLPANTVVRPAVRRVVAAASKGSAPVASSSRKRETISRA